jgi:hypothetical protein
MVDSSFAISTVALPTVVLFHCRLPGVILLQVRVSLRVSAPLFSASLAPGDLGSLDFIQGLLAGGCTHQPLLLMPLLLMPLLLMPLPLMPLPVLLLLPMPMLPALSLLAGAVRDLLVEPRRIAVSLDVDMRVEEVRPHSGAQC